MKALLAVLAIFAFVSPNVRAQTNAASSNAVFRAGIAWLTNSAESLESRGAFAWGSGMALLTEINTNAEQKLTITSLFGTGTAFGVERGSMSRGSGFSSLLESLSGCYAPGSGLIGWWQGETNAIDSWGAHHGIPTNGVSLDSGIVENAFSFDGTDQAVTIPYSSALATPRFTMEMWVNPQGQVEGGINQAFIFGQSYGRQLVLNTGEEGVVVALYATDEYGSFYGVSSTFEIPIGDWTHLAGKWDGTTLSLYINGVLDASGAQEVEVVGNSTCPFSIGGIYDNCGYYGQYFNGLVDEVSLYDRALFDCEIEAIYLAGAAGKCKMTQPCAPLPESTVGRWRGEGDATDLFQSHDGILQNGAGFASGAVGQSFFFGGNNQALEIPYAAAFANTNFSLEAWLVPSANVTNALHQSLIFGQGYGRQLVVRQGSHGVSVAFLVFTNLSSSFEVVSTGEIPIGEWTHVVGTWDGTNLSLYINGALDEQAAPGIHPWDSGCALHIGGIYKPSGDCSYVNQFFNGWIDEVALYKSALSAEQVRASYNAGTAGYCYDSDSDGMPDWWEIKYFGGLGQTASGDFDGDGVSNYLEFLQGRNPTIGATSDAGGVISMEVYTPLR